MDLDARTSCLRAVTLVARNARLCASVDPVSDTYKSAVASAVRVGERAAGYFKTMKGDHAPHERQVRVVGDALEEAEICVRQLVSGLTDADDLALQAEKIERAVARAERLIAAPG